MNRFSLLLGATLAVLCVSPSAQAQETVLRDHLSAVRLSAPPGADLFSVGFTNFDEAPEVVSNYGRCISGFRGDGRQLHSYSAYYFFDSFGAPNLGAADFRLSFWSTQTRMLSDPAMTNPQAGDRTFVFDAPSNANWQTPVLTVPGSFGPIDVYRFDFNLDAAGITTSLDALQFISMSPRGSRDDLGQAFSLPTMGGAGTIGTDPGWVWFPAGGVGPQPVLWSSLGGFSAIGTADRITTIPAPSASLALGLGLLLNRRKRS